LNILPASIAERLQAGEKVIVDDCQAVTVLLVDIADFTQQTSQLLPQQLVVTLSEIFSFFEQIASTYELEKVKIFGDAYMLANGLPASHEQHIETVLEAALTMQRGAGRFQLLPGHPLALRIGIHSGPVIAGVVGVQKFSYELWGDTVLTTRNLLAHCSPGEILVSSKIYTLLQDRFQFESAGDLPGGVAGVEKAYLLRGKKT
jgi:urea transport system substrate-binding protein